MKISARVILAAAALLVSRNADAAPQQSGGNTAHMEFDKALDTNPDLSNFALLLKYSPEELNKIKMAIANSPIEMQVYAPENDSPHPPAILDMILRNSSATAGLTRRGYEDIARGYYFAYQRPSRSAPKPGKRKKRRDTAASGYYGGEDEDGYGDQGGYGGHGYYDKESKPEMFDYPDGVSDTLNTDPKYANLGKGVPQRLVSQSTGPEMLEVFAGEGKTVQTTGTPIRFKGGVIYPITDYFSLPEGLYETLDNRGLQGLLDSITKENLVQTVENYSGVTLFAPLNPTQESIKSFLLLDNVAYSPDLVPGTTWKTAAGTTITIEKSKDGEGITANGCKIVSSDSLVRNGVVHYIDNMEKSGSYY